MAVQLKLPFFAIGDQVSISAVPEAYYRSTGERLFYDDDRIWVFQHNPYIDRRPPQAGDSEWLIVPDARLPAQVAAYERAYNTPILGSQTEFMLHARGLKIAASRHPRLYRHEDVAIVPHKVVVHTTGSDRTQAGEPAIRHQFGEDATRVMSDAVIESIKRNYKGWLIVQVGTPTDIPLGGPHVMDLRGKLDLWETAAEIASASRFIGVNSGPMHIANCYPRVAKRIVLMEFSEEFLSGHQGFALRAGDVRNLMTSWLDPSNAYFNRFGCDLGVTYGHRLI